MGYNTKIDWADTTWNPVTGCLHGCEYCYAQKIANRFCGSESQENRNHDLARRLYRVARDDDGVQVTGRALPYPYGFDPTFHRYRLDDPKKWSEPRTIFVCSMADLFGEWVPDKWIKAVFDACEAAPQHRYLFLTKNPARYVDLYVKGILQTGDRFWYGTTVTEPTQEYFFSENHNTFISVEPILKPFGESLIQKKYQFPGWIIVGAETGNRKGKVSPEKWWIDELVHQAQAHWMPPVFMKESLREIMGEDFRQEFPWGTEA